MCEWRCEWVREWVNEVWVREWVSAHWWRQAEELFQDLWRWHTMKCSNMSDTQPHTHSLYIHQWELRYSNVLQQWTWYIRNNIWSRLKKIFTTRSPSLLSPSHHHLTITPTITVTITVTTITIPLSLCHHHPLSDITSITGAIRPSLSLLSPSHYHYIPSPSHYDYYRSIPLSELLSPSHWEVSTAALYCYASDWLLCSLERATKWLDLL